MVALFVMLLAIFLAAFFGFDSITHAMGVPGDASAVAVGVGPVSFPVSLAAVRLALGGGIVFFEFLIIILSVFDRVLDTIKAVIKPIAILVPLAGFVYSTYQTFAPVVQSLLPGASANATAMLSGPDFNRNILLTFGTMLLYLLLSRILSPESSELRALRAEVRKLKGKSR